MADPHSGMPKLVQSLARRVIMEQGDNGDGTNRTFIEQVEITGINQEGIVETVRSHLVHPYDCGHSPDLFRPGGMCAICKAWQCVYCLSVCHGCRIPLGACHWHEFEDQLFCQACLRQEKRKAICRRIQRFFWRSGSREE